MVMSSSHTCVEACIRGLVCSKGSKTLMLVSVNQAQLCHLNGRTYVATDAALINWPALKNKKTHHMVIVKHVK